MDEKEAWRKGRMQGGRGSRKEGEEDEAWRMVRR
jgi:hypothetical protein